MKMMESRVEVLQKSQQEFHTDMDKWISMEEALSKLSKLITLTMEKS